MTEKNKKNKKQSNKTNSNKKLDQIKKELDKLKNEVKEKDDKLLRAIADLQNYRKRMEKELKIREEEIKKKYLFEILDLYDLLKIAYNDKKPREGLKLIINNIECFLNNENIRCIESIGKKFDHNLHHAVTTIEKDDCEDNVIVEEIKKGYMKDDNLLRPSHVIVSKKIENKK